MCSCFYWHIKTTSWLQGTATCCRLCLHFSDSSITYLKNFCLFSRESFGNSRRNKPCISIAALPRTRVMLWSLKQHAQWQSRSLLSALSPPTVLDWWLVLAWRQQQKNLDSLDKFCFFEIIEYTPHTHGKYAVNPQLFYFTYPDRVCEWQLLQRQPVTWMLRDFSSC